MAGQHACQVRGHGGHARRVHQIARGVLPDRTASHVRAAAEGRTPQPPACRPRGRPTVQHQGLQILPDAVDRLARRGQPTPPYPDPGLPGPVDHQAGQARPQRTDHMPFLHIAARASRQLEPAVERRQKLAAFGAGHGRPGPHQPRRGRTGVRAPVVQDVPDGAEESRDGHQGAVCGPHPDDPHPRPGHQRGGRGASGRGPGASGETTRGSQGCCGRRVRRGGCTTARRHGAGPSQRAGRQERVPDHAAAHAPLCLQVAVRPLTEITTSEAIGVDDNDVKAARSGRVRPSTAPGSSWAAVNFACTR